MKIEILIVIDKNNINIKWLVNATPNGIKLNKYILIQN